MAYTNFDITKTGDKRAINCEGCGIFASCEPLKYTNGDNIMLCGNCHQFTEIFAKKLVEENISSKQLKLLLKTWRDHKHEAKEAMP